eukprot:748218-Hanusia_phi.AAC.3
MSLSYPHSSWNIARPFALFLEAYDYPTLSPPIEYPPLYLGQYTTPPSDCLPSFRILIPFLCNVGRFRRNCRIVTETLTRSCGPGPRRGPPGGLWPGGAHSEPKPRARHGESESRAGPATATGRTPALGQTLHRSGPGQLTEGPAPTQSGTAAPPELAPGTDTLPG